MEWEWGRVAARGAVQLHELSRASGEVRGVGRKHLAHHARAQWNPTESKEETDHQGGRPGYGGRVKTQARAALLDEPASVGSTKERCTAPLSLACPKTLLWRFKLHSWLITRQSS